MAGGQSDDLIDTYLSDIGKYNVLSKEEEQDLARRIQAGDQEARDLLIKHNLRLVVFVAKKYSKRGLSIMDLVEEGNLGLLKAVDHFDPERGVRFSTYATWWIKQAIRRSLTNTVKTIRIPAYMVELIAKWKMAHQKLVSELGTEPTLDEVADTLELSEKKEKVRLIKRIVGAQNSTTSLHDDKFGILTDVLSDDNVLTAEEILFNEEEIERIRELLGTIDERESDILRMRYGLDEDSMTLEKIGEKLGLTRERVRQIENEALDKLNRILTRQDP